ncbi:hypothetical protein M514_00158 [Trichuris suis]|uniref:Uncharacterized protein n=1 Tax=Trichuris suis TaxID=68888 RepID=A0A085NU80_9BILA|nr:hypothetical protein M513_00158 [Trichuris suis]KFD73026.1 hypothetical protein M514_00158 [Trichuris suis]
MLYLRQPKVHGTWMKSDLIRTNLMVLLHLHGPIHAVRNRRQRVASSSHPGFVNCICLFPTSVNGPIPLEIGSRDHWSTRTITVLYILSKFMLRKNSSSYLGSDSSDSCLRARSDSCGSDEYASTSRNGTRCQPRARLFDSKFSSCSEDLVEIDFRTASSSFGQSQSGSLGSTDSLGRSRANSMGTSNMMFKQTWLPKVEQITEQELTTPSARLVQDLFDHERSIPSDTVADYVPMSPCAESVAPDSPFSNQEPSRSSDYLEMTCDPSTSTDFRMSSANEQQCNEIGKLEFNFPGVRTASASDEATLHCLKTVSSRKKTGNSRRHTTSDPCSSSIEETQMKRMKRNPNTAVQYPLSECSSSIQLLKKLGRRSWHGDCVDEIDQTPVRNDCVFSEAAMPMNAGNTTKSASCRTEGDYVFVCPPPPSC